MVRNPFLSSTRNNSTISHSLPRAQQQYPPDRSTIQPEILYSTGPSGPVQLPQQLHVPRPHHARELLNLSKIAEYGQYKEAKEIFPGPPVSRAHHNTPTMSMPDLLDSSPTTTSSPSSRSLEISVAQNYHLQSSKQGAVTGLSPAGAMASSDYLSQRYQLEQSIWSIDHEEIKLLRQVACIAEECARIPERKLLNTLNEKDVQDLKDRIISEYSKYINGRDGQLSLSTIDTNLEDAAARYNVYGFAYTDVSNVNLVELIREFSPMLTVAEFMPFILAWVGPADRYGRKKGEKGLRRERLQYLKKTIIEEVRSIWVPSGFEAEGKRFLTRKEYVAIAGRLSRRGELNGSEVYRLHNTIRALDMLELLGKCLEHELIVSTDVTIVGETLALHFCKDGYSFGLHTLFKRAGDKICRGNAEKYACLAVDKAAKTMWYNVRSHEDREFLTRLGRMVDEYGDIQRKKYSDGAPKNRPDDRPPRADHRRQVTFVSNLTYRL